MLILYHCRHDVVAIMFRGGWEKEGLLEPSLPSDSVVHRVTNSVKAMSTMPRSDSWGSHHWQVSRLAEIRFVKAAKISGPRPIYIIRGAMCIRLWTSSVAASQTQSENLRSVSPADQLLKPFIVRTVEACTSFATVFAAQCSHQNIWPYYKHKAKHKVIILKWKQLSHGLLSGNLNSLPYKLPSNCVECCRAYIPCETRATVLRTTCKFYTCMQPSTRLLVESMCKLAESHLLHRSNPAWPLSAALWQLTLPLQICQCTSKYSSLVHEDEKPFALPYNVPVQFEAARMSSSMSICLRWDQMPPRYCRLCQNTPWTYYSPCSVHWVHVCNVECNRVAGQ